MEERYDPVEETYDPMEWKYDPMEERYDPMMKVRSNGMEVRSNGRKVRSNGMEVRSNGMEVRSNGRKVRSNGMKVRSTGTRIRSNGMQVTIRLHFCPECPSIYVVCGQFIKESRCQMFVVCQNSDITHWTRLTYPIQSNSSISFSRCQRWTHWRSWHKDGTLLYTSKRKPLRTNSAGLLL